ncbi:pspc domain-containing protein [Bacillus sp. UMTAT18]|uniref:PspC domain-containing protein n=1 Tax=Bacillus TaxID=1386 RepID=UPI00061866D1|nr:MULTISPECIES: PspC domain-containing protein [Bacillus]KKC52398.1 pspc domain-containing protein [Bacillus sp. UMTAT18]MDA1530988.1 PspC domain-containing protein [Bacillus cereus group sp. TH260-2LC]MDU2393442.1 PspC domain-containing protein [Bacillus sp. (in: firmicutes)]OJD74209.1 PspC domain-containing protein [Bacillus sp. P14-1]
MKKLYKSTQDKQISGVLGGLSDKFGIDVSILRIVTALSFFFTGGIILVIYIIAAIVLPTDKEVKGY